MIKQLASRILQYQHYQNLRNWLPKLFPKYMVPSVVVLLQVRCLIEDYLYSYLCI